jgi:hypothetical protein
MKENFFPDKAKGILFGNNKLLRPTPFHMRDEWVKERIHHKFHAGFVVYMTLDSEAPDITIVYFDGGRRRTIGSHEEGIVLEWVREETLRIIEKNIKIGDLVKADEGYNFLDKVASPEDLEKQGISVLPPSFDWERVVGVMGSSNKGLL